MASQSLPVRQSERPKLRDWVGNIRVPAMPTIHADWVVIGLATVAQSFIVGFWSYTRFFNLDRAHEIPGAIQVAFAIIAGLALDAAVIFSATSGLEPGKWNLDYRKGPVSLGGWAAWTPFIAFIFSSLIAVDTFAVRGQAWDGSELLHIGWPSIVFALSKYGASLRQQRLRKQAVEDDRYSSLEKENIRLQLDADTRVKVAEDAERAMSQRYEALNSLINAMVPEFKATREQWQADREQLMREREQAELAHEADRARWIEFTASIEQQIKAAVDTVRAEERRHYESEIERERLGWLGAVERVNADWLTMQGNLHAANTEIEGLMDLVSEAKMFQKPSEKEDVGKTDLLRKFFADFHAANGRDPLNKEIAEHFGWEVTSFNTLAGRVRRQREADAQKAQAEE